MFWTLYIKIPSYDHVKLNQTRITSNVLAIKNYYYCNMTATLSSE